MTPKMMKFLFITSVTSTVVIVVFKETFIDINSTNTGPSSLESSTCVLQKSSVFNTAMSNSVSQLLQLFKSSNVTVVLLDPFLLLRVYLQEGNSADNWPITSDTLEIIKNCRRDNLITLGVFERDSQRLTNLATLIKSWTYYSTVAEDRRTNASNTTVIVHHWLTDKFDNLTVHIPVLIMRSEEFIWVPEVTDKSLGGINAALPYPVAFRMNSWKPLHLCQGVEVLIPGQLDYFLWQLPFMQFQECNSTRTATFQRDQKPKTDSAWDKRCAGALRSFNNFIKELKIPAWIVGGTLLGWYRQCGVIPYTSDLDFATNISLIIPSLITRMENSSTVVPKIRFGKLRDSLEYSYSVPKDHVKVDLFFHTENDFANGTFLSGMWPQKKMRLRWEYPQFEGICSVELLGNLCYAPCNGLDFITADYGSEWNQQQKDYVWFKSHKNLVRADTYSDSEWPSAMHKFS